MLARRRLFAAGLSAVVFSRYVPGCFSRRCAMPLVGTSGFWQNAQNASTNMAGEHTHTINVGENSVNHTHTLSFNTESSGVDEGRPENLNLYAIIKT